MKGCLFCEFGDRNKILDGKTAFVFLDNFPVTQSHSLIITKRHFASFFDATLEELFEINYLLKIRQEQILQADKTVEGFNVGINIGLVAGQSIPHLHVHLIPRRFGDVENPRGGVRGVIPDKKDY